MKYFNSQPSFSFERLGCAAVPAPKVACPDLRAELISSFIFLAVSFYLLDK